jgi:orotidine-5'-phosphate decarboxylase
VSAPTQPFADRLTAAVQERESCLCVGLDPRAELLPPRLLAGLRPDRAGLSRAYERFCCGVVDAVADVAAVVKPQVAFFEALGGYGITSLERVCAHARAAGLLVLLDAKRGDMADTAEAYAQAWLDPRDGGAPVADAMTVNPYLGADALEPFLRRCDAGAGVFVLVRTSNPGGAELQELELDGGGRLWERAASLVARLGGAHLGACGLSSVGAVVGATVPEAILPARRLMPDAPLLLPGVGAQGGSAAAAAPALARHPASVLVSASRSVIFAGRGQDDWQAAVRDAAVALREELRALAATSARAS